MLPEEITIGFESGPLYRPMTGVANYTFNMVRASLEVDSALRFVGFGDFGSQRIDLAALDKLVTQKNQADPKSVRKRGSISSRLAVHAIHKSKEDRTGPGNEPRGEEKAFFVEHKAAKA